MQLQAVIKAPQTPASKEPAAVKKTSGQLWTVSKHGFFKAIFDLTNPNLDSNSDFSDSVNPSIQFANPNHDS